MKLVIAGVPRAGKTTLAAERRAQWPHPPCRGYGPEPRHTDDLIHLGWSGASDVVSTWFYLPGPWIVEGVAAVRALRKWLRANATSAPCDRVIWLGSPRIALTPGQAALAKGCATVWREVRPELLARNVHVEEA